MNNLNSYLKRFPGLFPKFKFSLLIILVVALARYFNFSLTDWTWQWIFEVIMFSLGAGLSHLIFLAEPEINRSINRVGYWMAREEPSVVPDPSHISDQLNQSNQPSQSYQADQVSQSNQSNQTNQPTRTSAGHSWLRNSTFLLILPILAIYLLTSSSLAIGFGFLYGLSLIYLMDIWDFSRNQNNNFIKQYFWTPPSAQYIQTLIMGYGAYFAILTVLLIFL